MNKKLISSVLLLIFVSLSNLVPTVAQPNFTDQQKSLIQDLQTAINHFQQLTSYSFSGDFRSSEQKVSNSNGNNTLTNQAVYQTISGQFVKKSNSTDVQVTLKQQITSIGEDASAPFVDDTTQQFDAIVVDKKFYLRFTNITPLSRAEKFPKGWARIDELPEFSGSEFLDLDTYFRFFSAQISYPINEQSVLSIQEMPVQSLSNKTEVKGIKIIFDGAELFKSGQFDKLINYFNIAPSAEIETRRTLFGQYATYQVTYWIGIDDQMIYRTDLASVIRTDLNPIATNTSNPVIIDQMIGSSISFTDFNNSSVIEPPI